MTIEDRLRKAFRAQGSDPAPERAWAAIEERAGRRGRLRRRARHAAWLAPVVVAAVGVPAYEALAPAGRPAQVVTTTPASTATPAATASPTATASPPVEPTVGAVTLPVKTCPIQGPNLANAPTPPATVTVSGIRAGDDIAAYGGTMVLLGPAGWACDGWAYEDGGLELAVHPPDEELPINPSQAATETVQAIIGFLPSPMTGVSKSLACPLIASARAAATTIGLPCAAPPAGETVDHLDPNFASFEDPPGLVGDGAQSGRTNAALGMAFYNPATQAAGMVTCVVPAAQRSLCGPVLSDFRTRYGPPLAGAGATATGPATQREVAIYSALLRYAISELRPTNTATPRPTSANSTFYVLDHLFEYHVPTTTAKPLLFATPDTGQAVPDVLMEDLVNLMAPTALAFVPNVQAVTVPDPGPVPGCTKITGAGFVFLLGVVPSTGDQVQVYLGERSVSYAADVVYELSRAGASWTVTGRVFPEGPVMAQCG